MPLEGHWRRQQTPFRSMGPRERRVLAAIAGALAIAVAVVIVVSIAGGSSSSKPGCIDVTVPSTTGGARARVCGQEAVRYCRQQLDATGRDARATQDACRREGYPAPPAAD